MNQPNQPSNGGNANANKNRKNTKIAAKGFISWELQGDMFAVSGTYTDANGERWDLGYAKCTTNGLRPAIEMCTNQAAATLSGRGVKSKRQESGNDGR